MPRLEIGDKVKLNDKARNSLTDSVKYSATIIEIKLSDRFANLKLYRLSKKLCTSMVDYTISGHWIELDEPTIHIGDINV